MSFDKLSYRRKWVKAKRSPLQQRMRIERLTIQNKCHVCEILLTSKYHTDCPGVINMHVLLDIDDSSRTL